MYCQYALLFQRERRLTKEQEGELEKRWNEKDQSYAPVNVTLQHW